MIEFLRENRVSKFFISVKRFIQRYFEKLNLPEYTFFSVFAIVVGAAAGIAAVLFHETIDFFTDLFFNHTLNSLLILGGGAVILIPVLGMLIQAIMIKTSPDTAKQKGVYDVIKAVALRNGYIPFKTTIFHFIAPAVCIGSGGTVGPEGPAAQIGGGVASKIGVLFGLTEQRRRMFTTAGAGAAIAAVFNTPLGGVFFALEIILLNDFQSPTFSALILASVTASVISRIFLGNQPTFIFTHESFSNYNHLIYFFVLGIVAGLVSVLYIKYSDNLERIFKRKILGRFPQWIIMSAVGVIVGLAGYFFSDIFGIGYAAINKILAQSLTWKIVAVLFVLKFILVPLILHSGGFGGLFAPSLFMGASLGYLIAFGFNSYFDLGLDTTLFVLVAMGALLGGINSIPISSIMIIFEMTRDYTIILPLMLSVIISTTIVQLVLKGSVHLKHLEQLGLKLKSGREINLLAHLKVRDLMSKDIVLIPGNSPLTKIVTELIENKHTVFYVTNQKGEITGQITERELRPIIAEYESLRTMLIADDIANTNVRFIHPDDTLDKVLTYFDMENVEEFPVVDPKNKSKIFGSISRHTIIKAYNKETLKYNLAEGMARQLQIVDSNTKTKVTEGYSIIEKTALPEFVGKTLAQLKLRNKYGIEVLMIKKAKEHADAETQIIAPHPDYKIENGDSLVLFGSDEAIEKIKSL